MKQAFLGIGAFILILIFLYCAGKMFTAGCLSSWIKVMGRNKEGEIEDGKEK